jgi:hypothetical protein
VLGLRPSGVQDLPAALLDAGLRDLPGAVAGGRVDAPAYNPSRDPDTGVLNPRGIAQYAVSLADVVGAVLARGCFPVVLGGDCSILLGNLLALRRRGRYGRRRQPNGRRTVAHAAANVHAQTEVTAFSAPQPAEARLLTAAGRPLALDSSQR